MPCRFRYAPSKGLFVQHFSGRIDLPMVLDHYDRVLGHPALPGTRHELTDMSRLTESIIDGQLLNGLVSLLTSEYLRRMDTFQRGAVILGTGPGEFAARLFLAALPEKVRPRYALFRDRAPAKAWLRLGHPGTAVSSLQLT